MKNVFLSVIFLLHISNIKMNESNEFFRKCALMILKHEQLNFVTKNLIYILHDNNESENNFISSLIKKINKPLIISDKILNSFRDFHRIIPGVYLLYAVNFEKFKLIFLNLNKTHPNWHPTSKFVIFVQQVINDEEKIIQNIIEILKTVNVYDFEIIIEFTRKKHFMDIFTWFPFNKNNKCGNFTNITKVGNCTEKGLTLNISLNEEKIPNKKLPEGCVFKVCGFHWPPYTYQEFPENNFTTKNTTRRQINFISGYNVLTIEAMSHRHNLKIQYVPVEEGARWGMILDNGTWTGALGILQSGKAEAAIGGALQTFLRFDAFDCSPTFTSLFFKFYMPLPTKIPHWKSMIDIFSSKFWIIISVVYIATSVFIRQLSIFSNDKEKNHFKHFRNCFLTLWQVTVGSPSHHIPQSMAVSIL